jgi:hypothetical protein
MPLALSSSMTSQRNKSCLGHFRLLKMITFIILITFPFFHTGCEEDGGTLEGVDANISEGENEEEDTDDIDARLEEAMQNLPGEGRVAPPLTDPSVLDNSGPEILSAFPPDMDRDQDGIIDVSIEGRPNFPVDNCIEFYNPEQNDLDGNGIGDACE